MRKQTPFKAQAEYLKVIMQSLKSRLRQMQMNYARSNLGGQNFPVWR